MRMRYFSLVVFVLILSACALPRDPYGVQQVVPTTEVKVAAFVREGMDLLGRGRNMDAEINLRKALYLSPDSQTVRRNLAVILGRQGLYEESEELLLGLLQENPASLSTVSSLAQIYFDQGDFDRARLRYMELLELSEGSELPRVNEIRAEALRSLAVLEFTVGNEEEALCYSGEAYNQSRGREQELARHARLLNAIGLHDRVLALLGRGSIQGRRPAEIHQVMLAHFAKGSYTEAARGARRLGELRNAAPEAVADARWIELLTMLKTQPEAEKLVFGRAAQVQIRDDMQLASAGVTSAERSNIEDLVTFIQGERLKSNPRMIYWPQILGFEALRLQRDLELVRG